MPDEEININTSVGPDRSFSDTITTTHSRASFQEQDHNHISFVSAITMDDALTASDRLSLSDRHQYQLDPRLHSLEELDRASDPEVERMEKCFDKLAFSEHSNASRFADSLEGADPKLCGVPRRRISTSFRSTYSSDLEFIKSSSTNLDLLNAILDNNNLVDDQKSSSSDLDYRTSERWDERRPVLDEESLGSGIMDNDETESNEYRESDCSIKKIP
ncbi:unnamed protein product [Cylindrotheca closterium]|uniref:Uncharacterized protein n=1 Tax=Cylindrotheca closterium TaxID=2856 RepID=A0AAD2JPM3_9STRA|nr:unnamed protein product [Cylindrotheca closterium]